MRRTLIVSALLTLCLPALGLAQVRLEIKRPDSATSTTRSTFRSQQVLTIAGMDVKTDVEAEETTRTTNGKRMPDGTLRVEEKTEASKIRLEVPGAMLEFDSANPDAARVDNPMLQVILDSMKARVGTSYTLVFGKDNRVTAVEGIDRILENAGAAADALRTELDPEKLKRAANQAIESIPDKPLMKGDRWERTQTADIGGGQMLTFTNFFEYQGTVEKDGKTLDKIGVFSAEVKYALDENSPLPLKVVSSELKVESSMGMLLFDREAGRIVESTSTIRITGPMTFSVNGMELPGKVDLTMESSAVSR